MNENKIIKIEIDKNGYEVEHFENGATIVKVRKIAKKGGNK
jgi:hypothetical protein